MSIHRMIAANLGQIKIIIKISINIVNVFSSDKCCKISDLTDM
jgi:hypothetical protein